MKYHNTVPGKFIVRRNRFVAEVEIAGKTEVVHVKNTGRCKELLIPGVEVYLEKSLAYSLYFLCLKVGAFKSKATHI